MNFEDHVEDYAKKLQGNWKKFESFYWCSSSKPEDADSWCIYYTHNRGSGNIDLSNHSVFEKSFSSFLSEDNADIECFTATHFAVGWVSGYAIRVKNEYGKYTKAFKKLCELLLKLEDYPLLDEEDHSSREYEDTIANIEQIGKSFVDDSAPKTWSDDVFSFLYENEKLGESDGHGNYPDEDDVKEALFELGFLETEDDE